MSFIYNKKFRDFFSQFLLVLGLVLFLWYITTNLLNNIDKRGIETGFSFLSENAGFAISESAIFYDTESSYFRAFLVGLVNTLIVSGVGIFFATTIGLIVGIARLSKNYLISKLAMSYIEIFRNIPILLQILFWYNVVIGALPNTRNSTSIFDVIFLNNRGIITPKPIFEDNFFIVLIAIFISIIAVIFLFKYFKRKFEQTGKDTTVFPMAILILIGVPLIVFNIVGSPMTLDYSNLKGFNYVGGMNFSPEFLALTFALSIYTATYIAEAVRSGIQAVPKGQKEAAASLGLSSYQSLKSVVLPQAVRISIPPIINQYLNLVKNSSLATAVGYPDIVTVFSGTVLNQTGQALEVIMITMAVYLFFSLVISGLLNIVNKKMQIKER